MRFDSFAHRCEFAVMHVRSRITNAPELAGNKLGVAREESRRADGPILVKGLGIWIVRAGRDVMQLQIRVSRDPHNAVRIRLDAVRGDRRW